MHDKNQYTNCVSAAALQGVTVKPSLVEYALKTLSTLKKPVQDFIALLFQSVEKVTIGK